MSRYIDNIGQPNVFGFEGVEIDVINRRCGIQESKTARQLCSFGGIMLRLWASALSTAKVRKVS